MPNMFPEGENKGLYHTADATLWFFHALARYLEVTKDRATLRHVLPKLLDIVEHHMRGTRFGIGVDPDDGLLRQGAAGYQLTWMDAKVDDWVVTPRRGKAVEINALWYNALGCSNIGCARNRAMPRRKPYRPTGAARATNPSTAASGTKREVISTMSSTAKTGGNDPACRPNQIFAISLEASRAGRRALEAGARTSCETDC